MENISMTTSERQVMRVIWAYPHSRSQEIIMRLENDFSWKPATIKTLLNRLKRKSLISMEKIDGKFYYNSLISEEEQLAVERQRLLSGICNTNQGQLLANLVEESRLSQKDISRLIGILEERRATAPEEVSCSCVKGQCRCAHHD